MNLPTSVAERVNARELFEYANTFLEQGILLTRYMEELREEARKWLSKQTSKT